MRLPAPPRARSAGRGGLQGIDEQVSREAAAKRFRIGRTMSRLRAVPDAPVRRPRTLFLPFE